MAKSVSFPEPQFFDLPLSGLDYTVCNLNDPLSIAGPLLGLRTVRFPKEVEIKVIRQPNVYATALVIDDPNELAALIGGGVAIWKGQRSGAVFAHDPDARALGYRMGRYDGHLGVHVEYQQIAVTAVLPVDAVPGNWPKMVGGATMAPDAMNAKYGGFPLSLFAFPFANFAKVQAFLRKRAPELGDTCGKCGHEVKVRPSFTHTFTGCMC